LPEPLSPTTPSVVPARTDSDTPSTALTCPIRRNRPRRIGNHTLTLSPSTTTGASGSRGGTALRLGRQQPARVGVLRPPKTCAVAPASTISPCVITQTRSAIWRTIAEVVGDQQQRHAEPILQLAHQLQDLRLDRHVERGGRLVGDQDVGLVGDRHRDHDALALPARELVRVGAEPASRRRPCRRA
jgi:hypothetical protein